MELWIRSQDRLRLAKMDSVIINTRNKKEITSNYSYSSDGYGKDIPLGEYKTEERALEVLDEIQKLIKPKTLINMENFNTNDARVLCDKSKEYSPIIVGNDNIKIEPLSFIVYEMPKE